MVTGYSLYESVLDEGMVLILLGGETGDDQIKIKNEDDLFLLIQALLDLYRIRMENK